MVKKPTKKKKKESENMANKTQKTEAELETEYVDSVNYHVNRSVDWLGKLEKRVTSKRYAGVISENGKKAILAYLREKIDRMEASFIPAEGAEAEGFKVEAIEE